MRPEVVDLFRLAIAEAPRFPDLGRRFWEAGPRAATRLLGAYLGRRGIVLVDRPVMEIAMGARDYPDANEREAHVQRVAAAFEAIIAARSAA